MSLPWVRLDSNIGTHDKVLRLLAQPNGSKAFVLYIAALGYSGAHGTDGKIERYALTINHGTPKLAVMLIEAGLWEYHPDGGGNYQIHNWDQRQEMSTVREIKRQQQQLGARKTNCKRYHGADCGCWRTAPGEDGDSPTLGAGGPAGPGGRPPLRGIGGGR